MPMAQNGTVRNNQAQSYLAEALGALERNRLGLFDELMALAISNELSERARRQLKGAWDRKTAHGKRAALERMMGITAAAPANRPALRIVGEPVTGNGGAVEDRAAPPRRQSNSERRQREYLTPA